MTVDVISILNKYGTDVVTQIKANLASTGTNATGKTSASLRFEVIQQGEKAILKVFGRPFIATVETGRKATPEYTKPSASFVQSIREWAAARGIDQGAAYAIAKSIHKKGTPPTGKQIISNVVNQSLTDRISKDILQSFSNLFVTNVKQIYGNRS